jgi:hypothetical protein
MIKSSCRFDSCFYYAPADRSLPLPPTLQIPVYGAVEMIIVGASIARPHNILLAKYCDFRRKYGIIACGDHDLLCKSCGRPMAAPTISYDR